MPPSRGGRGGGMYNMPTVMDALGEVVQVLAQAKLLPDAMAYMPLIQALEQGVIQIIDAMRKKTAQQVTQGPQQPGGGGLGQPGGGMGGPPGMGGGDMGGPGGGGPQGGGAEIGPGGGAGMAGFGTPNPDELRRTLAGPAAVGGMS